jgi:hypothetical protein
MVFFAMEEDVVGFERDADCFSSQLYTCRINIGFIYLRFIDNYYFTINTSFFKICSGSIDIHVSHPSNAIVNPPLNLEHYESAINVGYYVHEIWVKSHKDDIMFGNVSDNEYLLNYGITIHPMEVYALNEAGKADHWRSSLNPMLPSAII